MLDHLVRQREAGVPARKIAEELGVGSTTLEQKIAELCLEGQPLRKRVKQEWPFQINFISKYLLIWVWMGKIWRGIIKL